MDFKSLPEFVGLTWFQGDFIMAATKKTEKTEQAFEEMTGFGADAFKEGYQKMAENMSGMADFQKGYVEAFMASAGAFAKGIEKLTSEQSSFAKSAFEDTVANAKAASSAKSFQDAIELNSEFVRTSVEKNMGQFTKVAEIFTETAKETAEPMTSHYNELVEKVQAFRP